MARGFTRVVLPVDFSRGNAAALEVVARLRGRGGSLRLTVLHVVDPTAASVGMPAATWADILGQLETAARHGVERFVAQARKRLGAGARVQGFVVHGTPADAICRTAKRLRADVIVIGTHGRTGIAHALLGSVAERVVRLAGRPVLTVPMRSRARR